MTTRSCSVQRVAYVTRHAALATSVSLRALFVRSTATPSWHRGFCGSSWEGSDYQDLRAALGLVGRGPHSEGEADAGTDGLAEHLAAWRIRSPALRHHDDDARAVGGTDGADVFEGRVALGRLIGGRVASETAFKSGGGPNGIPTSLDLGSFALVGMALA
jgi:hypothetical protein